METITVKKDFVEVDHVTDRDTFFKMKAEQKLIANELRTGSISEASSKELDKWRSEKPAEVTQYKLVTCDLGHAHQIPNPQYPAYERAWEQWLARSPNHYYPFTKKYARCHNIVYGLTRGRTYREIERTVREHNEPDLCLLTKVAAHYGLRQDFLSGVSKDAR